MINLFLAAAWALVGVGLLVWHGVSDDPRWRLRMGGFDLSLGWFALVLCAYNLVRLWSARAGDAQRQALASIRSAQHHRRRPVDPDRVPDPNFDFTDEPPRPRGLGDRPPSPN